MQLRGAPGLRSALVFALALACGIARAAGGDAGTVAARAERALRTFSGFGRVAPITVLSVNAAQAGIVAALHAAPGDAVARGALLARLIGPEVRARLARRRAAVSSAQAELVAAHKVLVAARQQRAARLATRAALARAQAGVTRAQASLSAARVRLSATSAAFELRAPVAGSVLALDASNGERVAQGASILTLQPAHGLWLKSAFYGAAARAIHPGMRGRFEPAGGGAAVPVRVRTVFATVRGDGAREAGLLPIARVAAWTSGEAGTVVLEGSTRTLAAVPSRALILDAGRWWVLVRGPHGDERRTVTPGPSRGEWTLIRRGLKAGTRVVVTNAYLEFHREVARRYLPPD